MQFVSPNVGYIISANSSIGDTGKLLKTSDGGESWSIINLFDMSTITDMSCVSENVLYINGNGLNNFKLLKSIDGGISFEIVNTDTISGNKIQFINEQIGYSSSFSEILKTTDGGVSWIVVNNSSILSFYFINENIGFLNTSSGLFKTVDGGNNYSYLGFVNSESFGSKLYATNQNIVWGAPFDCLLNGSSCHSFRGENAINSFQVDLGIPFRSIHFATPAKGYAVTYGGGIFKNSTGTMLGVNELEKKDTLKIYPNPASDQITIYFNENPTQSFTIKVTDILGKKVFSNIYNENSIIINTKSFSKGVYILTIDNNEKRQTQKIIIN